MSTMDLATATAKLNKWLDADDRLCSGQSYQFGDQLVTRVDARTVTQKINYWSRIVDALTAQANGATLSLIHI